MPINSLIWCHFYMIIKILLYKIKLVFKYSFVIDLNKMGNLNKCTLLKVLES